MDNTADGYGSYDVAGVNLNGDGNLNVGYLQEASNNNFASL